MCAQKKTRRRISADEPAKPAGRELRRKVYKTGNGLLNFSMHAFDQSDASTLAQLTQERAEFSAFSLVGSANVAELDPETVAKRYLAQALQSSKVPPSQLLIRGPHERVQKSRNSDRSSNWHDNSQVSPDAWKHPCLWLTDHSGVE